MRSLTVTPTAVDYLQPPTALVSTARRSDQQSDAELLQGGVDITSSTAAAFARWPPPLQAPNGVMLATETQRGRRRAGAKPSGQKGCMDSIWLPSANKILFYSRFVGCVSPCLLKLLSPDAALPPPTSMTGFNVCNYHVLMHAHTHTWTHTHTHSDTRLRANTHKKTRWRT